jgi:hypothetical protein
MQLHRHCRFDRRLGPSAAIAAALFVLACDSGRQLVGWEMEEGDTYLPWYGGSPYYRRWANPPVSGPDTWLSAVWMQSPINAERFRAVGINLYTGLWNGPTEEQLTTLARSQMPVICDQSGPWRMHTASGIQRGWLLPDQPDNAQLQPNGTFGPCTPPSEVLDSYRTMVTNDPTRPVRLGLGRGIVEPDWVGRGACSGRAQDYADYVKASDILAVVIYPILSGLPLETVAAGVEQARTWSRDEKPVLAVIQASRIDEQGRPTAAQIKAQVWMSIMHRAAGIEYYCHQQRPTVVETDCLDDAATAAALRQINRELTELAPVLDTLPVANGVTVSSSDPSVPVDTLLKRFGGATYLFAVGMRSASTRATFSLQRFPAAATAEVLGEGRSIAVSGGTFEDDFSPYGVHLYRLTH